MFLAFRRGRGLDLTDQRRAIQVVTFSFLINSPQLAEQFIAKRDVDDFQERPGYPRSTAPFSVMFGENGVLTDVSRRRDRLRE